DQVSNPGSDAVVASAQNRGIPVVSSQQMLTWLDGRNGSSFGSLSWSNNALSFTLAAAAGSRNMQAMVPMLSTNGILSTLKRNGVSVTFTSQTIKGIASAFFPAVGGSYVATYPVDTLPPLVSGISASPHTDGTAAIGWTTNESSTSRVDYGTSSDALTQSVS